MYQLQKNNFPNQSKAKTILIPLIVGLLMTYVGSMVFGLIAYAIFNPTDNSTGPGDALGMILNVTLGTLIMCKVSKVKIEDLGWHKKGIAKEVVGV